MTKIFISYRREEGGYVASILRARIEDAFGAGSVFLDVDDIPLGVDFRVHLMHCVNQCNVMLVLIGDDWLAATGPDGKRRIDDLNDFVRIEIQTALEREIPVIPVLIGRVAMPPVDVLPGELELLAYRHAAECRSGRDFESHLAKIITGIQSLFSEYATRDEQARPRAVTQAQKDLAAVRIFYIGKWFLTDWTLTVLLDGKPLTTGSAIKGFDVTTKVPLGHHALEIKMWPKTRSYSINLDCPGAYTFEAKHSRTWGTFTKTLETDFIGGDSPVPE